MQSGQPGRDEMEDLGGELDLIEVDHLGPKRVGDGVIELLFVNNAVIDHRLLDRLAVLGRLEQDVIGLGPVHQALIDEEIGECVRYS